MLDTEPQRYTFFGLSCQDTGFKMSSGYFDSNTVYFIKFQVLKVDYIQKFKIKLISDDYCPYVTISSIESEENQAVYQEVMEREFSIPAKETKMVEVIVENEDGTKETYQQIEYVNPANEYFYYACAFKPNLSNVYNKIILELNRDEIEEQYKLTAQASASIIKFATVKNLIPSDINTIKSIGLQGSAGLPFEINGEYFRLGKSELFTLEEDDFVFESIGICCEQEDKNNEDEEQNEEEQEKKNSTFYFILDYKYE
jgi:hypothetical protein